LLLSLGHLWLRSVMSADVRYVVVSVRQTSGGGGKCPVTAAEDRPSAGGDVTMYRPAKSGPRTWHRTGTGPILDRTRTRTRTGLGPAHGPTLRLRHRPKEAPSHIVTGHFPPDTFLSDAYPRLRRSPRISASLVTTRIPSHGP